MVVHHFLFGFPDIVDQGVVEDRHDTVKTLKDDVEPSLELFRRWRNHFQMAKGPTILAHGGPKGGQHTSVVIKLYMPETFLGINLREHLRIG